MPCIFCIGKSQLQMNYYSKSCPKAEEIIKQKVIELYNEHGNTAVSWVRNLFHDCIVKVSIKVTTAVIIFRLKKQLIMIYVGFHAVMRRIPAFRVGGRCSIGADNGEKFWDEKFQVCENHQSCCWERMSLDGVMCWHCCSFR